MSVTTVGFRHRTRRPGELLLVWEGVSSVPAVGHRIRREAPAVDWLVIEVTWHGPRQVEVLVGDRGDPTTDIRAYGGPR